MISYAPTEIRNTHFPDKTSEPNRHTNLFSPFQFYKFLFEGTRLNVEVVEPLFKVLRKTKILFHFVKKITVA